MQNIVDLNIHNSSTEAESEGSSYFFQKYEILLSERETPKYADQ
jgi:hypothetical protein